MSKPFKDGDVLSISTGLEVLLASEDRDRSRGSAFMRIVMTPFAECPGLQRVGSRYCENTHYRYSMMSASDPVAIRLG